MPRSLRLVPASQPSLIDKPAVQAIEKGNIDGAKIYAQNAIRKKTETLNYLRLASRLDAVVSRLDTQAKMQVSPHCSTGRSSVSWLESPGACCCAGAGRVAGCSSLLSPGAGPHADARAAPQTINKSMAGIVGALDRSLKANNLEQVASTMDQFEKQFENLDIQSEFVNDAMNNQAAMSTPEDEVNNLMMQVADENSLELNLNMPNANTAPVHAPAAQQPTADSDFSQRLAQLRGR